MKLPRGIEQAFSPGSAGRIGSAKSLKEVIGSHENNYTLIRLILASSVIYFHSFPLTKAVGYVDHLSIMLLPITDVGGLAVKLFFFLSGLFVAQSFSRDPGLLGYAVKRIFRIWPGYVVCLIVTTLMLAVVAGQTSLSKYLGFDGLYDYILRNSVFDLTWQINGVLSSNRLQSLNGPIHTLPMEVKMYGVLGVIGLLGMVRTPFRMVLAGCVAIAVSFSPLIGKLPFALYDADWSRTAGVMFLAGVVACGVSTHFYPRVWQALVLIAAAWLTSGLMHEVLFYAASIWLVLLLGQARWLGRLFRPQKDLSYGIYVYGWPCQQAVLAVVGGAMNPYLLTVFALSLASAFAALSWVFVEKPAIDFGKFLSSGQVGTALRQHAWVPASLVLLLSACWGMHWALLSWDWAPVQPMQTRIVDFGPHESRVGEPINKQPDGGSAIWISLDGAPADGANVVMAGHRLPSQVSPGLATAAVPSSLLAQHGEKKIYLERRFPGKTERSNEVSMRILP